jgi:hypothetical protein
MRLLKSHVLWGLLLITMGVLFLVESLGLLALGGAWSVLFFAGAVAFFSVFLQNREHWWAVIPGMTLLGIGILIVIERYLSPAHPGLGGAIFLGSIALAFWIIYFSTRRTQWWAIIPGGVLLALATSLFLEPFVAEDTFAGLFMLGIGLTFAVLYLLPTPEGHQGWALIPAAILAVIGLGLLLPAIGFPISALNLIWPLALILIGGYLLLRSLRR